MGAGNATEDALKQFLPDRVVSNLRGLISVGNAVDSDKVLEAIKIWYESDYDAFDIYIPEHTIIGDPAFVYDREEDKWLLSRVKEIGRAGTAATSHCDYAAEFLSRIAPEMPNRDFSVGVDVVRECDDPGIFTEQFDFRVAYC